MNRIFTFIIASVLPLFLISQTDSTHSLVWKITGKNFKNPSYLVGTMHVSDERVFVVEQGVLSLIDQCNAFSMEVIMDELNPEDLQQAILMKDSTIQQFLTEAEYKILDSIMIEKTGTGMLFFGKVKPFFIAAQLMQAGLTGENKLPMDLEFLAYARKAKKNIYGLETFQEQIDAIDQISLREQINMLRSYFSDGSIILDHDADALIDAYISQNIEEMYRLSISEPGLPSNFVNIFIHDRNSRMTKRLIKLSKKESVVHAVGAAHLGGPFGIIALLKKQGYTVEPVLFD